MGRPAAPTLLLLLTLSSHILLLSAHAATTVGFYSSSCPNAESIIRGRVQSHFASDPTITAGLLRMFFHECFVTGCDASLLLDSTPGNRGEKDAGPNLSVRGFELINDIKTALEAACPGIVSCADIMAFATRDSVVLAGGPNYPVGGGRLDSLTSRSTDANILPSPTFSVEQSRQAFASQGLSLDDMVALLGGHSVGFSHCGFFSDRVYNFQGTGQPDPTMNPALVSKLRGICPAPPSNIDPTVPLDQGTRDEFDAGYYTQLQQGNGILQIDQELAGDAQTSALVNSFTNPGAFFSAFVKSMQTLGELKIKQNPSEGQVRLQCNRVNPPGTPPPTPRTPPTPTMPPTTPQPQTPTTPLPPPTRPPTTPPLPPTPKPKPPAPKPKPPTFPTPRPKPRPPTGRPKPRPRPRPRPRRFPPPRRSFKPRKPPVKKPTKKPPTKPVKKPTKKPAKKPVKKTTKVPVRRF